MEALQGKKLILLFRLLKDASKKKGAKLAFQTEHSTESTLNSDTTITKDGPINTGTSVEEEIPFTCIMARGDEVAEMLKKAHREAEVVEVWEVDITKKNENDKYPAEYRQGLITSFSKTANSEDLIELSVTLKVNGIAQSGELTLTADQEEVVQYAFRDTEIVSEESEIVSE